MRSSCVALSIPWRAAWGTSLLAAIISAGCASPQPPVPALGSEQAKHQPVTIFEVCMPDDRIAFQRRQVDYAHLADARLKGWMFVDPSLISVAPASVDWVEVGSAYGQYPRRSLSLEQVTKLSNGTEELDLAGSTLLNQPLFRSSIPGSQPSEYLAVGLRMVADRRMGNEGVAVYWYKVPLMKTGEPFGAWRLPSWVGNSLEDASWKMMHDVPVETRQTPPSNAPRMRFAQLDVSAFYAETRRRVQAEYAAWIQYAPERKFREGYVAAPAVESGVPGC